MKSSRLLSLLVKTGAWRFFVLLGLFQGTLLPSADAQNLAQTYELAEAFYERGDYANAAQTYRRVLFFDEWAEFGLRSYQNIADCLYQLGQYGESAVYYDRAYYVATNDSLRTELLFQKASCYLLTQQYRYAQVELLNLPDSLPPNQARKRDFYEGILYFSLEEYDQAKAHFLALAPDSAGKAEVNSLFLENEKISQLSPRKARRMSMFLPGLGQFYAGDVKNGFNSLLLNSGLLYLGVRMLLAGSSGFDALFTILPWFQRYYTGGFKKAEIIAGEKKQKRRNELYNKLLDAIPDAN